MNNDSISGRTQMSTVIFLHDFDRSEHSDSLQAILGRALIIATRFDAMCLAAANHKEIKETTHSVTDSEDLTILLENITVRYQSLANSIGKLDLPKPLTDVFKEARKARNSIAHDLAKGMTGGLDNRINENLFVQQVSELVTILAYGDFCICKIISFLNQEPFLVKDLFSYKDQIVQWVIEK